VAEYRKLVNEGMRGRPALEIFFRHHDKTEKHPRNSELAKQSLRDSLLRLREVLFGQGCRSEHKMPRYILLHIQDSAEDKLGAQLHRLGFEVQVARSAQEAIEIAQFQKFDILIADVDDPEDAECSLLERMRGQQSSLKAIALCDFNRYERKNGTRKTGFNKYAQRGSFSSVKAAIGELFERRECCDLPPETGVA
jgi:CheY-like chemotaxis protein